MKQLGKVNTEKIERIIGLMKEFDNLDCEVRRELEALLPEEENLAILRTPLNPIINLSPKNISLSLH